MTDPRETGSDPRFDAPAGPPASPPPRPWWSQPSDSDQDAGQDAWGAPRVTGSGQPPYGSYAAPSREPAQEEDPWRSPGSTAVFGTGAPAWGYPTDTIGSSAEAPSKARRGALATAALVVVTALVAGGAGGYLGARSADREGLLDPGASLGSGSSAPANVDRAPESVAGIAAAVMRSTVSIAVQGGGNRGTGSGVVLRSDGYILTNNHVVASAANGGQITVTFDDGATSLPGRIVGLDPVTDLAVLRVDSDRELEPATLGRSRDLVVGDPVIAIGSPLGLSGTVTTGIVSALNRTVDVPAQDGQGRNPLFNAIQTDAAINPGNSGGALVNARGEVIGINSAIATLGGGLFGGEGGGSIGVGFAIPIDEASSVAEEIIRTGRATHPAIGVAALTVSGENVDRPGARVQQLTPGGAAAQAGLQPGDLIVQVQDEQISSVDELILAIRQNRVGDTVTVTYVRGGETRTAELTLQDLQAN
ncbi:MAG TPA: trypsin-like peptidase domain-containing protein [Mycobacteriales bacterium]|nr:trypsin-like peptidase domain-containing protein [Mycobacteriales bacterium]